MILQHVNFLISGTRSGHSLNAGSEKNCQCSAIYWSKIKLTVVLDL
jgi:hypothetical protein